MTAATSRRGKPFAARDLDYIIGGQSGLAPQLVAQVVQMQLTSASKSSTPSACCTLQSSMQPTSLPQPLTQLP